MKSKDSELSLDCELHERLVALGFAFAKSDSEILLIEKAANELKETPAEEFSELTSMVNSQPRFKPKKHIESQVVSQESIVFAAKKGSGSDYFKRTVLAAEILSQLHREPTMGRLKLQKLIFLCQHTSEMELHTNFLKQAMGPYDPKMMRSLESQMKKNKWFVYCQNDSLKYHPQENCGNHKEWYSRYFHDQQEHIDYLITLFRTERTRQVELVATIFDVWQVAQSEIQLISSAYLVAKVYDYSTQKEKFSESEILQTIRWMIDIQLHPKKSRIIGL